MEKNLRDLLFCVLAVGVILAILFAGGCSYTTQRGIEYPAPKYNGYSITVVPDEYPSYKRR